MSGVSSPATTQTAAKSASAIARLSASQARNTTQWRSLQPWSAARVSSIPCEKTFGSGAYRNAGAGGSGCRSVVDIASRMRAK